MCGICGAAWTDGGRKPTERILNEMIERLVHRGPDDSGARLDSRVALGFRRLAIVDLPGGRQPLSNEDGTIWTVFNGEIYNFPALRHRLEAKGHVLKSLGDTEVLVHLYEDEGTKLFRYLRGMFALAIWDARRRRLILGRDRLGQKPLVYRLDGDRIVFASELKALLALPASELPREVDPQAIDRYLTYGYIPHPGTIFQGVRKLPPAHYAVWEGGKFSLERYWEPDWNAETNRPVAEDESLLREVMEESVREQMVADVPLGAFLSGGIDSTIVVGLMRRATSGPIKTFSIGFADRAFDESGYAKAAAERFETEHHSFEVGPRAWEDLPKLVEQFDEPFADSSALPTWIVARETRAHVTAALTGDAGDELFGGYDRYRALVLAEAFDRLPATVRESLSGPIARGIPASSRAKTRLRAARRWLEGLAEPAEERYFRWVRLCDEPTRAGLYSDAFLDRLAEAGASSTDDPDPAAILKRAFDVADRRDGATRAMVADLLTYLPGDLLCKVDWASMAHGLECRGPFLDHRAVELALSMPIDRKLRAFPGRSKAILKSAFADLLPPAIRRRRKMGFGVPIDRWFRGPLRQELRSLLLDSTAIGRGIFRPEAVERLIVEHETGARDHAYRLWALQMLESWFRRYMDTSTSVPGENRAAGDRK